MSYWMKALVIVFFLCAFCPALPSQGTHPRYAIGIDMTGSKPPCPVFVHSVWKNSPAAQAGIRPGDRLIAVDGNVVATVQDAAQRVGSISANPVTLQFARDDKPYTVTVRRVDFATLLKRSGWKMLKDGTMVKSDWTDAEVEQFLAVERSLDTAKDVSVVFPGHYPADKQLYYPGFEAFVWDAGNQVTVGGIEDGPASRAGVRWGDQILAVDGVDPHKKSIVELESMLSATAPRSMRLTILRAGVQKTFSFELAEAARVLHDNQWQVIDGKLVPLWAPEKYLPCFQ
jgi:C-terminal processing protease CtpA/Prc